MNIEYIIKKNYTLHHSKKVYDFKIEAVSTLCAICALWNISGIQKQV